MKQWYFTEHKKIVLEKQNLKNELEILQYQINPHFLFNVLNNLYSLAIENDDQAIADGISKLSCLMRYNIYTSKNDKVFLKNEVEYINNYIKLQEIRFTGNYKLKVYFTINGNIESKLISPFIFIMFVENAFKYGISLNNKSIIKIELDVFDNYIEFKVSNFKNKSGNRIDSGIGLDNVKRRLEHYYPTKHLLTINDSSTDFNIYLRINC
ncbi:MAG: histidine kinase [Bacteroidales bacterium]|nr:histidine kinase [Bacteroidales bacterium]